VVARETEGVEFELEVKLELLEDEERGLRGVNDAGRPILEEGVLGMDDMVSFLVEDGCFACSRKTNRGKRTSDATRSHECRHSQNDESRLFRCSSLLAQLVERVTSIQL